ncbi:hypothetical protein ACVBEG_27780 [Pseudomonas sp. GG8]
MAVGKWVQGGVDGKNSKLSNTTMPVIRSKRSRSPTKFVNDGVKFVVGHLLSDWAQPASDIYEDEGIIIVLQHLHPGNHRTWL